MSRKNWTDDKLFFRLLNNKTDTTYWGNISELWSRTNEAVFKRSADLAKSRVEKEKILGINLLSQLGKPPRRFYAETMQLYYEILETETNPKVLQVTLYGIGHNNEKVNTKQSILISSFKDHQYDGVRNGVVMALLGVENKIAINTMLFLTEDKVSTIRDWATFGIGTQVETTSKQITDALWKRVNDKHQVTKLEAILGLAKRKDSGVKDVIKKEFSNGECGTLIFEAMMELGDKEFLSALRKQLALEKAKVKKNEFWIGELNDATRAIRKSEHK
ncbi:MAG: hypothetical protein V4722_12060 [Bacteroidota bacterium]